MTEQGEPRQRKIRWGWVAAGVVLLAILSVTAFAVFQPIKVLPRIRLAPGFSLTDQDGQRLTNEDLRGKIVLYNFSYAHCGAQCEPLNATLRSVQDQLTQAAGEGVPVELVTISFDPERDTPEVLRAYAQAGGADPSRWRFATGDPARMKNIIGGGFEAYYEPDDQGGFKFSPAFALVDGWGIIRAEYRNEVPTPERVLKHIEVIQEEVRNSKGVAKMGYEAAHLFLCYAQ